MKSNTTIKRPALKQSRSKMMLHQLVEQRYLHLMIIPGLLFFLLFKYVPMYGIVISFKNYKGAAGGFSAIMSAPWIGLKTFRFSLIPFTPSLTASAGRSLLHNMMSSLI